MSEDTRPTVFQGLNVLDLSRGFAGALATMVMADNGAAVVRVEQGGAPDPLATLAGYHQWHRGKERVDLDLRDTGGLARAVERAHEADVLVETFQPGAAKRLGLDYETISAENPGLVHCSITGFGERGRYAGYKDHEGVVLAAAGRMREFGRMFGMDRPAYPSVRVGSFGASQTALQGIAAALIVRHRTGRGQHVSASLLRSLIPYDMGGWLALQVEGMRTPGGMGGTPMLGYMPVRTRDGRWIQFANWAPHLFWNELDAVGLGHLKEDPRFAKMPTEAAEEDKTVFWEMLLDQVRRKDYEEWMRIFRERSVGADGFRQGDEGMDHPQARHNGHVVALQHPMLGDTEQLGPLVRFSETPSRISVEKSAEWNARRNGAAPDGEPMPEHALSDVTVLELAVQYAAPFGPSLLADMGARVIKVEPLDGDTMRLIPPIGVKTTQGKESIAVNLKSPEGQEIVRRLAEWADLVMHNYRPGVPERLGIDYETLRTANPGIVYLYAGAYGSDGPYGHMPAYHPIAGAIAGGASHQAGAGVPPPADADLSMDEIKAASLRLAQANEGNPDTNSAMVVATAMLLGLLAKVRHGVGQQMLTTMLCANGYALSEQWIRYEGKTARRELDADLHGLDALSRLYETADGWVFLACPDQEEWEALCVVLGEPGLAEDERFTSPEARLEHDEALVSALAAIFKRRTADEWEADLAPKGIGCVRADRHTFAEFLGRDPQSRDLGLIADVVHPVLGPHWRHGATVELSASRPALREANVNGQHTRAILAEIGYTEAETASLKQRGIVNYPD